MKQHKTHPVSISIISSQHQQQQQISSISKSPQVPALSMDSTEFVPLQFSKGFVFVVSSSLNMPGVLIGCTSMHAFSAAACSHIVPLSGCVSSLDTYVVISVSGKAMTFIKRISFVMAFLVDCAAGFRVGECNVGIASA